MNYPTCFPGVKASIMRRLVFAPVTLRDHSRNASLPEGQPIAIQAVDGNTLLFAWVDAPLEGPADYYYVADPSDYAVHGPHAVHAEQVAR